MHIRSQNYIEDGVNTVVIELDGFTSMEKVQAETFGPILLSLGGNFNGTIAGVGDSIIALNFSIESIQAVVNPNTGSYKYRRYFKNTAETPDPTAAAAFYAQAMATRISGVVSAWKNLTQTIVTDINESV